MKKKTWYRLRRAYRVLSPQADQECLDLTPALQEAWPLFMHCPGRSIEFWKPALRAGGALPVLWREFLPKEERIRLIKWVMKSNMQLFGLGRAK